MTPASVSVVTIARDGADDVSRLVRSIQEQEVDIPVQIVVVDDGSAVPLARDVAGIDGPADVEVVTLYGEGNRSEARNAGANVADGDLLVLVDSDQVAPSGWLADHLRWHRALPDLFLNGHRRHCDVDRSGWRPEVRERVTAIFSHNYARIAARWYLQFSCNLSIPARAYRELGGFDGNYRGWGLEDSDLGYRAHRAGMASAHSTGAWTWDHHHVVRWDESRVHEWESNRRHFLSKYPGPEAQAVAGLDNYPSRPGVPGGAAWLESFLEMDDRVRDARGIGPVSSPATTVTVLNADDAAYARKLLEVDGGLRIVDGLQSSGLDIDAFSAGDGVEYVSLLGGAC